MATIKHIFKGESLTVLLTFPEAYDMSRIEKHEIYIGATAFTGVVSGQTIELKLTSEQTDVMYGKQEIRLWLDDAILGVKKPYCGDIIVSNSNAKPANDSTSSVSDIIIPIVISETAITVGDVLYNYVKGEKGDPFTYSDFTPEQIAELQQPAADAISSIRAVELAVEQAEGLRVQAEQSRQTNTATAIQNAETATTGANNAASLANEKAGLANNAATLANEKAGLAATATTQANAARDGANSAAQSATNFVNSYATDLAAKELKANKQNSLAADGTGTKFPTVDAVNGIIKQTAGTSETDVMSQKATTNAFPNLKKVIGKNLYNYAECIDGKYLSISGGINDAANCKISPLIPITAGGVYYLTRLTPTTNEVRFVKSDGVTPLQALNPATNLPYSADYSVTKSSIAVKAPAEAAYFQFTVVYAGNGNHLTAQFELGAFGTVFEDYTERNEVSYTNLPLQIPQMIKQIGKNLFDKTKVISYYISEAIGYEGLLVSHATSKTSGLIEIKPDKIYFLTRATTGANDVRFVKEDGITPIKPLNPITGIEMSYKTAASVAVKAPAEAAYFQFTVVYAGTGNVDTAQFELGSVGTSYEAYTETKVISLENTPKEIKDLLLLSNADINPLIGKSVTFNGDSIAQGAPGAEGAYGAIISGRNKMVYENKSVGGATITAESYSGGTPRHWVSRTIDTMNVNADYIILEGGVNDASLLVPFGTVSSGYTAVLDDTTFCGAFESMLKQSILRWPGKKIGFVIVHRIGNASVAWNTTYQTAIIEMCKKWGIPVCDLFNEIPSLERITELKNTYTYNQDGWHPNTLGYTKYYCDKIEAFMKML